MPRSGRDAVGVVGLRHPDRVLARLDAALRVEPDHAAGPFTAVARGQHDHRGVHVGHQRVEGLPIHADCLPEGAPPRRGHDLRGSHVPRTLPARVPFRSAQRAGTLDPVATGLRERKKQAVKTALEQTALRLFMEKGYENTTVEEISEAVDVSTRTFFRYFATKDEVLFAHQAERLAAIRTFFAERPAHEPPADTVRAVVDFFAEDLAANADLLVVQATVYARGPAAGRHHPAAPGRADRGDRDRAGARARSLRRHPTGRHRDRDDVRGRARGTLVVPWRAAGRPARDGARLLRRPDPDPRHLTSFSAQGRRRFSGGRTRSPAGRSAGSSSGWCPG